MIGTCASRELACSRERCKLACWLQHAVVVLLSFSLCTVQSHLRLEELGQPVDSDLVWDLTNNIDYSMWKDSSYHGFIPCLLRGHRYWSLSRKRQKLGRAPFALDIWPCRVRTTKSQVIRSGIGDRDAVCGVGCIRSTCIRDQTGLMLLGEELLLLGHGFPAFQLSGEVHGVQVSVPESGSVVCVFTLRAGGHGAWVLVFPKILGICFSGSPSPYRHTYLFLLSLYMNKYILVWKQQSVIQMVWNKIIRKEACHKSGYFNNCPLDLCL